MTRYPLSPNLYSLTPEKINIFLTIIFSLQLSFVLLRPKFN